MTVVMTENGVVSTIRWNRYDKRWTYIPKARSIISDTNYVVGYENTNRRTHQFTNQAETFKASPPNYTFFKPSIGLVIYQVNTDVSVKRSRQVTKRYRQRQQNTYAVKSRPYKQLPHSVLEIVKKKKKKKKTTRGYTVAHSIAVLHLLV